ncbi:DUF1467 family protein [Roseovarius spongiae]|uniref:DUF1467 family protein n=1 Tax=Roseovarius spongiae TaxID=2320272 RepID=A0A3A8AYC2_9RHOB|nr:DUF1467 family protein [Roseovarius spongiae]RKF16419.1 DUF1467 family protein [Roseovarius spongiae]
MGPVSALVLYVVIWVLTFLVAIPIRLQTQGDVGRTLRGTHKSSPEHHHLRRKALITTAIATAIWVVAALIIVSGLVTLEDIDLYRRFGPDAPSALD